ncbi:polysaccharide deacetylase family protein [Winogradskyella sp. A3E31]|uniref:polysaccharide deacetylase family protein n=1 Tax=Winogradskyella sp. A3E31 TaxID=3349637 RepID=UPI00398BB1F9
MKLIPAKTPELVKTIFPSFIWTIDTSEKELYLTFDDGPTPEVTDWVLEQLKSYNAKATFFCIGSNINKYPDVFAKILEDGHAVGNHTYNHLKGWKTTSKLYLEDVKAAQEIIDDSIKKYEVGSGKVEAGSWKLEAKNQDDSLEESKIVNRQSSIANLFRPPYGKFKSKQSKALQKLGYKVILWDVLSFDWDATVSEVTCLNGVLSSTKKGSIIVFHDSLKAKRNLMYVLPRLLEYYSERGFNFKSILFKN